MPVNIESHKLTDRGAAMQECDSRWSWLTSRISHYVIVKFIYFISSTELCLRRRHLMLLRMLYSFLLFHFSPTFVPASHPWKQAQSTWNFNTLCWMVWIGVQTFFRKSDLRSKIRAFEIPIRHPRLWETSGRLAAVTASPYEHTAATQAPQRACVVEMCSIINENLLHSIHSFS